MVLLGGLQLSNTPSKSRRAPVFAKQMLSSSWKGWWESKEWGGEGGRY